MLCSDDLLAACAAEPSVGIHKYRLGIAYFLEDEYEAALQAFQDCTSGGRQVSEAVAGDSREWAAKCTAALEAGELPCKLKTPVKRKNRDPRKPCPEESEDDEEAGDAQPLQASVDASVAPALAQESPAAAGGGEGSVAGRPSPANPQGKRLYGWFQTPQSVTVRFYTEGVASGGHDVQVEEDGTALSVCLPRVGGSEFQYDLGLFAPVAADAASIAVSVEPKAVEVTLQKVDPVLWPALLPLPKGSAVALPAPVPVATSAPALADHGLGTVQQATDVAAAAVARNVYPSSNPRAKGKNWDEIEKELEEEDKPQGEAALQALFRQIYSKADPDTRRAMIKSFQTSGGTVLSTNWKEVAAKDYETDRPAPAGMEWKKPEQ